MRPFVFLFFSGFKCPLLSSVCEKIIDLVTKIFSLFYRENCYVAFVLNIKQGLILPIFICLAVCLLEQLFAALGKFYGITELLFSIKTVGPVFKCFLFAVIKKEHDRCTVVR